MKLEFSWSIDLNYSVVDRLEVGHNCPFGNFAEPTLSILQTLCDLWKIANMPYISGRCVQEQSNSLSWLHFHTSIVEELWFFPGAHCYFWKYVLKKFDQNVKFPLRTDESWFEAEIEAGGWNGVGWGWYLLGRSCFDKGQRGHHARYSRPLYSSCAFLLLRVELQSSMCGSVYKARYRWRSRSVA